MKDVTLRILLACIIVLMPRAAAFGQHTAKGINGDVQNAVTYNDRGIAKTKKGNLDAAMADFNQAIKLNPKYASAYNNRGNVKFSKGDLNGAMADYNQAIKLGVSTYYPE